MEIIMSRNWRGNGLELKGPYKCLGNSYSATIMVEGITYPSVEHAFQAAKVSDRAIKFQISKASLSEVRNLLEDIWVRPNWNDVKYATLHQLVKLKFESNKELAKVLMGTGTKLLGGKTEAELGSILMKVRSELA
tara:strand:- start:1280 stop:1684 length:405 start_codon:yes stop_codon:yes gene_type:complete